MKDLVCWKCETLIGKTTCDKDQDVVCAKCMHKRGVTIYTKRRTTGVWQIYD